MRDSVPTEEIVEQLRSVGLAFKQAHGRFRFEGIPSRASYLTTSRERELVLSMMRSQPGLFDAAFNSDGLWIWRLKAGEYLLPMTWSPRPDGEPLQILLLTDAPDDALIVSTEDGAESYDLHAGRALTIRQTCRFWLGPVLSDEVYVALSGLPAEDFEGDVT